MKKTVASKALRVRTANLGFPRIGANRELKRVTEGFWRGELPEAELLSHAAQIRKSNWLLQREAGIGSIPSNDFSLYDQMLDMSCLVGAVPARFGFGGKNVDLNTYFAMARGIQEKEGVSKKAAPAMEMSKWFDTNYHYIVPELEKNQSFRVSSSKVFDEFSEALSLGIRTRPVLIGPMTYLHLAKCASESFDRMKLLKKILPVYAEILNRLKRLGAEWVQLDEPAAVLDLGDAERKALKEAYAYFAAKAPGLDILVGTYFEELGPNLKTVFSLPVAGVHLDLVRGPRQLAAALKAAGPLKALSLGVVDGRNVWRCDLPGTLALLKKQLLRCPAREVWIAPSCSLMHAPVDLNLEKALDAELKSWMAYARQKLDEVGVIAKGLSEGPAAVAEELDECRRALLSRKKDPRTKVRSVRARLLKVGPGDFLRRHSREQRLKIQGEELGLPPFPTTTIGSYPQTPEVRQVRLKFKRGEIHRSEYDQFIKKEIAACIKRQEELDLDVLVHGEFERNDMVEYFGEQLEGFAFTQNGWVQSYGSRYVKPPVIFGDAYRKSPMTVRWFEFAQSKTRRVMKGMLTGPITILQWSFVRDDQPRRRTAEQIALAIRDEVADLEAAGARIIQIDEAAFREGLPLKRSRRQEYLDWAVKAFRLSSAVAKSRTQIHTHMCYSEFNDIIQAISDMDADVISIECSRSRMELLKAFSRFRYPGQIGPGVYDIHSPRVPSVGEITALLKKALAVVPASLLWVNPDCGLKTRGWKETLAALEAMVKAAKALRAKKRAKS